MAGDAIANDADFRAKLGGRLVMGASAGVILLGLVVICAAAWGGKDSPVLQAAQLMFTSLLPLLGTWVGTVLAFYYTRENFESATRSTLAAVRSGAQRLASIPAAQTMIALVNAIRIQIPAGKAVDDLSLKDIGDQFAKKLPSGQLISRLPITKAGDACVGIIHRSIWMEMQVAGAKQAPPVDFTKDNLGKLLGVNSSAGKTFKDVVTDTLAYIASDRTLADAKAAMDAKPLCQDVIVTQTGKSDEPMLGWIPNVDIARLSQA